MILAMSMLSFVKRKPWSFWVESWICPGFLLLLLIYHLASPYPEDRWGIPLTGLPRNIYVPVQTRIYVSILTVISMLRLFKCYFQQYFSYIVFWRIFFLMGETSIQVQIPELLKYITWLDIKWTWHVFCQKQELLTLHKHLRSKLFFWWGPPCCPSF